MEKSLLINVKEVNKEEKKRAIFMAAEAEMSTNMCVFPSIFKIVIGNFLLL